MNITDASQTRFDLGVEEFLAGASLVYHDVTFSWDKTKRPTELAVLSYSNCIHQENIRRDEACEKISRSKAVASELAERSMAFKSTWLSVRKRFRFCFSFGSAAILIAEEIDGQVAWVAA